VTTPGVPIVNRCGAANATRAAVVFEAFAVMSYSCSLMPKRASCSAMNT
jgi:hypothetical protein